MLVSDKSRWRLKIKITRATSYKYKQIRYISHARVPKRERTTSVTLQ